MSSESPSPPSAGADAAPRLPTTPAAQQPPLRIKRNTACVACRDAKVKCNASQTPNQPCLRCAKLELNCLVDKTHKRTSRRSKLEELAAEVRNMKEAYTPRPSISVPPEMPSPGPVRQVPLVNPHPAPLQQQPLPQAFPPAPITFDRPRSYVAAAETQMMTPSVDSDIQPSSGRPEPRALGSRVISGEDIEYYFQMYFEHFHPYFPIVRNRDPNLCYKRGHVLFWAIIVTACRRFARDDSVFAFLNEALPPQVWAAVAEPPLPLSTINALLILATWPSPAIRFLTDPSVLFSGIALHSSFLACLHTGHISPEFHAPVYKTHFRDITDEDAIYSWAGCNIISQKVSAYHGCPSVGSLFNHTIDQILSGKTPFAMPSSFILNLEAARFSNKVNRTMAASLEETHGVSHHAVTNLEEEFIKLQAMFYPENSDLNNFTLLSALLEIQIFYFRPLPGFVEETLRRNVLRCYNTAETMIKTGLKLHREFAFLHYAPHYVFRNLLSATCVILLVHFSAYVKISQVETSDGLIRDALRIMRACSVQDGDLPTRASNLIDKYWSMRSHIPRLSLTDTGFTHRLGASLVFDSLVRWKENFENARGASSSNPPAPRSETLQEGPPPAGPNADLGLADPFQRIDWDAFIDDFDWSFTSNYLGVA